MSAVYISTCKDGRIFDTMVCVADSLSEAREKAKNFFESEKVSTRALPDNEIDGWRLFFKGEKP